MKALFTFIIYSFFGIVCIFAQANYGNIWTIGYGEIGQAGGYSFGGILMDFNASPPTFTLHDFPCDRPKACISNENGQLLAYTDGCEVFNREHQIMLHGDSLNPGKVYKLFCAQTNYPLWQPTVFLPKPGSDSLYFLFHIRADDYYWNPMNLMYTIIDATGDSGKGEVLSKNNVILSDSIYLGNYVHAVRHGNGRDWWIVCPRRYSYDMHVSLLTPGGVEYKGIQKIDLIKVDSTCCISQQAFSTDGSKYFRNSTEGLTVYDFDRCSGLFTVSTFLDWDSLPHGEGGVVTSPNNRFLYLTSGGTVQQYDLWASDLANSMQVVGVYDGTVAPYPANFFWMLRGPDGKVYMITTYDNMVLHVIHHPDSLGLSCGFEQHAITLPALSSYFMPNLPNYKLGALSAPCTPTSETDELNEKLRYLSITPNPASNTIRLSLPQSIKGVLHLYSLSGSSLLTEIWEGDDATIDAAEIPSGFYWIEVRELGGAVFAGKVIVQH